MMIDAEILRRKGWTETEIERAFLILNSAYKKKSPKIKFLDKAIYWIVLIFLIIINIATVGLFVPIFLVIGGFFLYFLVFIVGLVFGWLFSFMINEIEELDQKDHLVDGLMIIALALVGVWVSLSLLSKVSQLRANSFLVAAIYVVAYMLPYSYRKARGKVITGKQESKQESERVTAGI